MSDCMYLSKTGFAVVWGAFEIRQVSRTRSELDCVCGEVCVGSVGRAELRLVSSCDKVVCLDSWGTYFKV